MPGKVGQFEPIRLVIGLSFGSSDCLGRVSVFSMFSKRKSQREEDEGEGKGDPSMIAKAIRRLSVKEERKINYNVGGSFGFKMTKSVFVEKEPDKVKDNTKKNVAKKATQIRSDQTGEKCQI